MSGWRTGQGWKPTEARLNFPQTLALPVPPLLLPRVPLPQGQAPPLTQVPSLSLFLQPPHPVCQQSTLDLLGTLDLRKYFLWPTRWFLKANIFKWKDLYQLQKADTTSVLLSVIAPE